MDADHTNTLNYDSLPFPQSASGRPAPLERTSMRKRPISGLTVVITGAGRGIGEATAELLSAQGATVALGDLDTALVQGVADRIGNGAVGAHLDVASPDSWAEFLVRSVRSARSTYSSTTPGSCRSGPC